MTSCFPTTPIRCTIDTLHIATTPIELPEAQATEVLQLVDALEQNDDVQNVYHSLV